MHTYKKGRNTFQRVLKRFSTETKVFTTCESLIKGFELFIGHNFKINFIKPLRGPSKTIFSQKNTFPTLERVHQTRITPVRGGAPSPIPGFANYQPLRPIIGPLLPHSPLGGDTSVGAFSPPKGRARSPRVQGNLRIFNPHRSKRSMADWKFGAMVHLRVGEFVDWVGRQTTEGANLWREVSSEDMHV